MSSVVPRDAVAKVQFFKDHIATWTTNATAIGTTTGAVTALDTLTQAALDAYDAHQLAKDAAKSATDTFHQAVKAMNNAGVAIIEQVRTKARSAGDSVYPLANIPTPVPPAPVGNPGTPSNFTVSLDQNGDLTLNWKCANPAGCNGIMYQIYRKIGTADATYVGGVGEKKFVDSTIPAGATSLQYQIQAVRSTGKSAWAYFDVNFGLGMTTVTEMQPKLAA